MFCTLFYIISSESLEHLNIMIAINVRMDWIGLNRFFSQHIADNGSVPVREVSYEMGLVSMLQRIHRCNMRHWQASWIQKHWLCMYGYANSTIPSSTTNSTAKSDTNTNCFDTMSVQMRKYTMYIHTFVYLSVTINEHVYDFSLFYAPPALVCWYDVQWCDMYTHTADRFSLR